MVEPSSVEPGSVDGQLEELRAVAREAAKDAATADCRAEQAERRADQAAADAERARVRAEATDARADESEARANLADHRSRRTQAVLMLVIVALGLGAFMLVNIFDSRAARIKYTDDKNKQQDSRIREVICLVPPGFPLTNRIREKEDCPPYVKPTDPILQPRSSSKASPSRTAPPTQTTSKPVAVPPASRSAAPSSSSGVQQAVAAPSGSFTVSSAPSAVSAPPSIGTLRTPSGSPTTSDPARTKITIPDLCTKLICIDGSHP